MGIDKMMMKEDKRVGKGMEKGERRKKKKGGKGEREEGGRRKVILV